MRYLTSSIIVCLLLSPLSAQAQKPSRRALIEQGEQSLQDKAQQIRLNMMDAARLHTEEKVIPVMGIAFSYPEDWQLTIKSDYKTSSNRVDIVDGDYVAIYDEQFKEGHSIFIYKTATPDIATMDDVWEQWNDVKRQPDHDNVYEYSTLRYIRELEGVDERTTTFVGKTALELEYTFNNWSKFWKESVIMFPWGKHIYTIKYRSERGHEDRFAEAYAVLLDTFRFLGPEPQFSDVPNRIFSDVGASHANRTAIERLHELGIVGGYDDGSFKPDATINRAEFLKIITSPPLVSSDERDACTSTSFPDVLVDAWFAPSVCVAQQRGIIGGYSDGTFRPEQTISFVEAAKIIASFFGSVEPEDGEWYVPFVRNLEHRKAIPVSIATLSSSITRGEMSEMIRRLYDDVTSETSKQITDLD